MKETFPIPTTAGSNPESVEDPKSVIERILPGIDLAGLERHEHIYIDPNTAQPESLDLDTPYTAFLEEHLGYSDLPAVIDLEQFTRDIPMVDLGAGSSAQPYRFAQNLRASGYVAVEPFYSRALEEDIESQKEKGSVVDQQALEYAILALDMLEALKRIPDASTSVFMSGIDGNILDPRVVGTDYKKNLQSEVERVLHPNGCVIVHDSIIAPDLFPYTPEGNPNFSVYTKESKQEYKNELLDRCLADVEEAPPEYLLGALDQALQVAITEGGSAEQIISLVTQYGTADPKAKPAAGTFISTVESLKGKMIPVRKASDAKVNWQLLGAAWEAFGKDLAKLYKEQGERKDD